MGNRYRLMARRMLAMAMFNPEYFYLKEEIVPLLEEYQIERINEIVCDFIKANSESDIHRIEFCPKCNCESPKLIKAGKAGSGKQMLQCDECNGRFVYDTGSLTFYSHQSASKWAQFIEMTIDRSSLDECAKALHVHKSTVFRMRHKLMAFLRMVQADDSLSGLCEVDETYIHANLKGLVTEEIGEKYYQIFCLASLYNRIRALYGKIAACKCTLKIDKLNAEIKVLVRRGWKEKKVNTKRGISRDLVCIFTGIERQGNSVYSASNLGKPNQDEVNEFVNCIESGSHVWVDGYQAYVSALDENGCTYTVCPTAKEYTSLDHLNNVNALHENFKEWMRKYRGISAVYSDRYANMLSYIYDHRSMGTKEIRSRMIRDLNKHQMYFYVKDIMKKDVLVAEEEQLRRSNLTSMVEQYRRALVSPMELSTALAIIGA